jgi:23S rRNA pseudouridine2605 synthase
LVNGYPAPTGHSVAPEDTITYQGKNYTLAQIQDPAAKMTIMFNKPAGYVVSRDGQGSDTIYDILPEQYHSLKPIGRLDKYSSGLLLLTNDGDLAQELTHPKHQKIKIYEVTISQPLAPLHRQMIQDHGVMLDDGPSKFELERIGTKDQKDDDTLWRITMREGRNRQIRRTFLSLGYGVSKLHRTQFGSYNLEGLVSGDVKTC